MKSSHSERNSFENGRRADESDQSLQGNSILDIHNFPGPASDAEVSLNQPVELSFRPRSSDSMIANSQERLNAPALSSFELDFHQPPVYPKLLEKRSGKIAVDRLIYAGLTLFDEKRYEEAEQWFRNAHKECGRILGPASYASLDALYRISWACCAQHKPMAAERLLVKAAQNLENAFGPNERRTLETLQSLAENLQAQSRYRESEVYLHRAINGYIENDLYPPLQGHQRRLRSYYLLANACIEQSKLDEAEAILMIASQELPWKMQDLLGLLTKIVQRRRPSPWQPRIFQPLEDHTLKFLKDLLDSSTESAPYIRSLMDVLSSFQYHYHILGASYHCSDQTHLDTRLEHFVNDIEPLLRRRYLAMPSLDCSTFIIRFLTTLAVSLSQLEKYELANEWFLYLQQAVRSTYGKESWLISNLIMAVLLYQRNQQWAEADTMVNEALRVHDQLSCSLCPLSSKANSLLHSIIWRSPSSLNGMVQEMVATAHMCCPASVAQ